MCITIWTRHDGGGPVCLGWAAGQYGQNDAKAQVLRRQGVIALDVKIGDLAHKDPSWADRIMFWRRDDAAFADAKELLERERADLNAVLALHRKAAEALRQKTGEQVTLTYTPTAAQQVSGIQQDFRGANNYRPNVSGDVLVPESERSISNWLATVTAARTPSSCLAGRRWRRSRSAPWS